MPETKPIDFSNASPTRVVTLDKGTLHRVLGVRHLFAIGYGDVGSSIYYALGVTTLYALGAAPLALLLAGIVFFCTVLTYAELSAALPEAGGSCSFARHAFNDIISFIAGWALLLDYIVTLAISVYTIGPYLGYFFPELKTALWNIPFALSLVAILFLLNFIGIKESARVSLTLTAFATLTQLAIITIGIVMVLNLPYLISHMRIGVANVDWSPTWPQFMKGVGMAMVAYIGIESISQLAGETKEPSRNVPRAMLLVMVTLFVMYFGISTVALSVISPHDLSTKYLEDPLAGIVAHLPVGSSILGPWIGILGAAILFVAANAGLIGASRLTYAMGEHVQLPRFFYTLHPKFKTPYISLAIFAASACVVILMTRNLKFLAELYNFGAMLAFALAHLSLLGLRVKKPDLERPFKAWGNFRVAGREIPLTAVLGALGTLAVWVDVILTKPAGRNLGFIWMGIGLLFFMDYRRRQRLSATDTLEVEKLKIPEFKETSIRKILVPTRGGEQTNTVQHAARVARSAGASLTALYVIEISPALPLDTFFPEKLLEADASLERAQAISREYNIAIEAKPLQSRFAGETIVEEAKKGGYDLIILGAAVKAFGPGRPGLGATVEYVLKHAPCRVWVCTEK